MHTQRWTHGPISRRRLLINVGIALAVLAALLLPAHPAKAADDFAVPNGHFFTQTGDRPGVGFEVRDGDRDNVGQAMRFWSGFQGLGGVAALGYPVSRVYREADGFYYQLFQRALLQWRPESGDIVLANLMDRLSEFGADEWLSTLGVPPPVPDDGSNGDFSAAVRNRLSWLTEPHIREAFLAASPTKGDIWPAVQRYGLPTSPPVRSGPFIVQRFQRIVLQAWLDQVPGMPAPGTVVPVLAGDLYRQDGLKRGIGLVDGRFVPEGATGEPAVVASAPASSATSSSIDAGLQGPLELLAANSEGSRIAAALRTPGVKLIFADIPSIALFSGGQRTVAIDSEWRRADGKTLAAVLAHEGSHLYDYLTGVDMETTAGCYRTEYTAFATQARVWAGFYGPAGKSRPENRLESELNEILFQVTSNPDAFATQVASLYRTECRG